MAIDIGADAIDRVYEGANAAFKLCLIEGSNPAAVAGTITKVYIYMALSVACNPVYVGTFIHEGSNVFSSRDYESVGAVATGLNEKDVDLDVEIGDYIGLLMPILASGNGIGLDVSGSADFWRALEDTDFPYSSYTFDNLGGRIISIYGSIPAEYPDPGIGTLAGLTRVSSIRHIFRPGFFRMQVGLGDLGFDIDVAETSVRRELDTARAVTGLGYPEILEALGMTVEEFIAMGRRAARGGPTEFPTYEAQIEYEEWFQKQIEELRKLGWEG